MAKKRLAIKPKLQNSPKPEPKKLPVQQISVEQIEKIAIGKEEEPKKVAPTKKTTTPTKKKKPALPKTAKRPQGRPRRNEPVKRITSHLPEKVYDQMKREISENGYSLNGFLTKVLRQYFEKKEA